MYKTLRSFALYFSTVIIFTILIGGCYPGSDKHQELLYQHYDLKKPEGNGPFPAVMLVPGCSGFDGKQNKKHYDQIETSLVKLGFVTLRVNYLAAQNKSFCNQLSSVEDTEDVAEDIITATEYLKQQPFVKKGAINLIGWSYGGGGALTALNPKKKRKAAPINAVVLYCPACEYADKEKWEAQIPILFLIGEIDDVVEFKICEVYYGHLFKHEKITVRIYDKARHRFDNPYLPSKKIGKFGGTIGYNEAAAKLAWTEVVSFLQK